MRKFLVSIAASLLIAGCTEFPGVHKIDIPQGNVVTQEMVDKLQPGMTRNQVRYVMGTPLVTDTFSPDRWDYIYSMRKGGEKRTQKTLSLYFKDDRLERVSGDYRPGGAAQ
ncbi:MAG: outer membrane protein assembly factor BamE [Oceanospirillaceae bacterium]|nr:outer membrane protein assembly factor BamE [Oceanospirillaceae bacterium]